MLPVNFGTCFGWIHPTSGPVPKTTGIVLCPTLGQEARHVHRQWRIMADRLASAGHMVLRFDYPDTGDSWIDPDAEPLEAWISSVVQAAQFLRDQGAARIALIGLRFGATLAALAQIRLHAAQAAWVDHLVLLAPIVSGRAYVREVSALARLSAPPAGTPADGTASNDNSIEASGLVLSSATRAAISAVDLRHPTASGFGSQNVPRNSRSVLILDPAPSKSTDALVGLWRARDDRDVTQAQFKQFDAFITSSHTNLFPEECLNQILAWLPDTTPPLAASLLAPPAPLPCPLLRPPGAQERPCRFGPGERLFGMLCEPPCGRTDDLAVIMCNNGSNPHHGHGRFAVTCGRFLAQAGVSSFRLDFGGLGDSSGGELEERPHLFDAPRDGEIGAAIALLQTLGYHRFVLTGICAGAYHALYGALANPQVVGLYAVNLPKFVWPPGDDPDLVMQQALRSTGWYLGEIRRKHTWARLLRGQINVGVISLTLLKRLAHRLIAASIVPFLNLLGVRAGSTTPQTLLATLARRGVRVHLLYGHDDPGVEELVRNFGVSGRKLARIPGCSVSIPGDVDHPISHARVRRAVSERTLTFLRELTQAKTPSGGPAPTAN